MEEKKHKRYLIRSRIITLLYKLINYLEKPIYKQIDEEIDRLLLKD